MTTAELQKRIQDAHRRGDAEAVADVTVVISRNAQWDIRPLERTRDALGADVEAGGYLYATELHRPDRIYRPANAVRHAYFSGRWRIVHR